MPEIEGALAGCDAWMSETCIPATVNVPDRTGPGFWLTAIVTVPLPIPGAPETMVIHESADVAFHEHKSPVVTETIEFPA